MIPLLLASLSLAVVAGALLRVVPLVRARNERLLVERMHGPVSDAAGTIGFSLLCSGIRRLGQIENLLSSEYDRYEVIVVLDAWQQRGFFESLAARYRMIRVDWLPTDDLPVRGVRSMWRSRRRCFRRLVLLDRPRDTPSGDLDAAASMAAYDWLLPVNDGLYMLPGALERLAVEVGQRQPGAVRSRMGESFVLLDRERVVAAGGFGKRPLRRIPRREQRTLREPLFYRPQWRTKRRWRPWAAAALLAGIAATVATGHWALAVLLLTVAVAWSSTACAAQLLNGMAGREVSCKMGVKNFTSL